MMATPSYEELLKGATQWKGEHEGVSYLLSHHGYRRGDEYPRAEPSPGTWCYYLLIPEQMYPHRWAEFACTRDEKHGYESRGPAWDCVEFDSEITWSSSEPYFDRKAMRAFDAVKVGCDYAHLWHMERGYPDTYESVRADAIRTVNSLLKEHPDRKFRSGYSHVWDDADRFYTAINGALVHVDDDIPEGWARWKRPASAEAKARAVIASVEGK